jgi:hypothetical protein
MEIESMEALFAEEVYKKFLHKTYYLKSDYSEDLLTELFLRLEAKNYKDNDTCKRH